MDKDIKYPSNSLYYSAPSKMIETHVNKPKKYKKIGYEEGNIWPVIEHSEKRWMYTGGQDYKRNRGKAARRRDRTISATLKQVHKPWHSRPTKDTIQDT